jgi:hypothetical protein
VMKSSFTLIMPFFMENDLPLWWVRYHIDHFNGIKLANGFGRVIKVVKIHTADNKELRY